MDIAVISKYFYINWMQINKQQMMSKETEVIVLCLLIYHQLNSHRKHVHIDAKIFIVKSNMASISTFCKRIATKASFKSWVHYILHIIVWFLIQNWSIQQTSLAYKNERFEFSFYIFKNKKAFAYKSSQKFLKGHAKFLFCTNLQQAARFDRV